MTWVAVPAEPLPPSATTSAGSDLDLRGRWDLTTGHFLRIWLEADTLRGIFSHQSALGGWVPGSHQWQRSLVTTQPSLWDLPER